MQQVLLLVLPHSYLSQRREHYGQLNVRWISRSWADGDIFLDKEYILISRRYQLHPASATTYCPSGTADAHSQTKKEELQKRKVLT
jgi:hypothetical protein